MNYRKLFHVLLSVYVMIFTSSPVFVLAQGGWTIPPNSIQRIDVETFVSPDDTPTTGTGVAGNIHCGNLTADDTITTYTLMGGCRTLYIAVTDRDATDDDLVLVVTGRNQFGGQSTERFVFSGGNEAIAGKIPFVAYPVPTITVETVDSDMDLISIYNYGFGLRGNPQSASDILSEFVIERSASPITYTENATSTFFTKYNSQFSTYTNAALTASDEVWIRYATSARWPTSVGVGANKINGPNYSVTSTVP